MNPILDDLKAIPGVLGAGLFSAKKGVVASNLPAIFRQEKLAELGKVLAKILSTARLNFPDTTEISLYYEESVVVARQVGSRMCLFVFCDPAFNLSLLSMSLNLAEEELRQSHSDETSESAPSPLAPPTAAEVPRAAELLESGPLAELLREMQQLLAKIMGPMAQIVFEESLERWARSVSPGRKTLPDLLEFLGEEIDDTEKNRKYNELVSPALERAGAKGV